MTHNAHVENMEGAAAIVRATMTPRERAISESEKWVAGTQYDHLADWFDEDKSIFLRKPCVVYPIVRNAIRSFKDLVLGEGRFPMVTCHPDEDEGELSEGGALSRDEGMALDKLLAELFENARFKRVCREAFAAAMGQRSSAVIWGERGGRLFGETVKAQWCRPEFDPLDTSTATRLVIQYAYVHQERDARGTWRASARVYRREIDAASDVTFETQEIRENQNIDELSWSAEKARIAHGLGFCPVVWYPFMRECSVVGEFDGEAIHPPDIYGMIHAHDISVSQRHRAALYTGDPQTCEYGVDVGSSPTGKREQPGHPSTPRGGNASLDNPQNGTYARRVTPKDGRRKGPGEVWQYADPESRCELLTLPAGALDAVDHNGSDLRVKLCESLAFVPLDADNAKLLTTTSGKALEVLRARQLERADDYREDVGVGLIIPSAHMLVRLANKTASRLKIPGLKKAAKLLARFEQEAS